MKLEYAVFTPIVGYAWQPGSTIPGDDLRHYQQSAVAPLPNYDMGADDYGGVFLDGDYIVFYRYLRADATNSTDAKRRPSVCVILGRCSAAYAAKLNFMDIFQLPVMNTVTATPPLPMEYRGGSATHVRFGVQSKSIIRELNFMSEIGSWFSGLILNHEKGKIRIRGVWPNLTFSVETQALQPITRQQINPEKVQPQKTNKIISDAQTDTQRRIVKIETRGVNRINIFAVAILATVIGFAAGWSAKTFIGNVNIKINWANQHESSAETPKRLEKQVHPIAPQTECHDERLTPTPNEVPISRPSVEDEDGCRLDPAQRDASPARCPMSKGTKDKNRINIDSRGSEQVVLQDLQMDAECVVTNGVKNVRKGAVHE